MEIWSYIGLLLVAWVGYRFFSELGKSLPILELLLLIAGLQWIVGPIIEYGSPSDHYKYYMYVDETTYMQFVVPGYAMLCAVILLQLKSKLKLNFDYENLSKYSNFGVKLVVLGIILELVGSQLPGALRFIAFILGSFKYVGAILLFFSANKNQRWIFYASILYLLLNSLAKALFHDFILWGTFFYMFWAIKNQPSFKQIFLTIFTALLFVATLQTIKAAYRMQLWNGFQGNKVELFVSLMSEAFLVDERETDQFDDGIDSNTRLNQGWIISAILDHVPRNRPFFDGSTIKEAVFASILPRFLNPDKKKAGGQENYEKFTGLTIADNTSMGISIIGEAYGNFGVVGGILFMGVWGLFLIRFWSFLINRIRKNGLILVFVPLIFLQVVKAETELVVVLNHLVKSTILVFSFLWFYHKVLQNEFVND